MKYEGNCSLSFEQEKKKIGIWARRKEKPLPTSEIRAETYCTTLCLLLPWSLFQETKIFQTLSAVQLSNLQLACAGLNCAILSMYCLSGRVCKVYRPVFTTDITLFLQSVSNTVFQSRTFLLIRYCTQFYSFTSKLYQPCFAETSSSKAYYSCFVFVKFSVKISTMRSAILTDVFRVFHQFIPANADIGHYCFIQSFWDLR
jgi:hypothetical protein